MQSADSEAVLNLAFVAAQCTGECWRWERLRNSLRSSLATIISLSRVYDPFWGYRNITQ
jgi:hypothetical protein